MLLLKDAGNRHCEQCQVFRYVLRALLSHHKKAGSSDRTNPSSHVRYSCLDKEELTSRLRQTKILQNDESRKVKQLEAKLEAAKAALKRASHTVDEETHSDLVSIVKQQSSVVAKQLPPNSFTHVFWHQQLKAAIHPNSRGMRWHLLMITWALYLQYQSAGAYETIRNYVALPSQRTLRDYSHRTKAHIGFSDEADKQLMRGEMSSNIHLHCMKEVGRLIVHHLNSPLLIAIDQLAEASTSVPSSSHSSTRHNTSSSFSG